MTLLRNLWSSRRPGWRLLRITLMLVVGTLGYVMIFEESFIYFPSRYPVGRWDVDRSLQLSTDAVAEITDCWFTSSDNVALHGWHATVRHRTDGSSDTAADLPVLLWCHGNAGNLSDRYAFLTRMLTLPVHIFIFDYRGYGRSEGRVSEDGMYRDVTAAYGYLQTDLGYATKDIVVFGNSLGGVPAVYLAAREKVAGVILQSTFTSVPDMAGVSMPFVPRFLVRTQMDSINRIVDVTCPSLFIHSPNDEVVPYRFGRQLYEAANEPRDFYEIAGATHNDIWLVGGQAYFERVGTFVRNCTTDR